MFIRFNEIRSIVFVIILTLPRQLLAGILPQHEGVYLFCENWFDTYTRLNYGHPDPLGVCAFIPFTQGVDQQVPKHTVEKIFYEWRWKNTWGWDFQWAAMAAVRVGRSDQALELLLKETAKNSCAINVINEGWYFPGNGGLTYAVAMMAAGWDGAPKKSPQDFRITVKGWSNGKN